MPVKNKKRLKIKEQYINGKRKKRAATLKGKELNEQREEILRRTESSYERWNKENLFRCDKENDPENATKKNISKIVKFAHRGIRKRKVHKKKKKESGFWKRIRRGRSIEKCNKILSRKKKSEKAYD